MPAGCRVPPKVIGSEPSHSGLLRLGSEDSRQTPSGTGADLQAFREPLAPLFQRMPALDGTEPSRRPKAAPRCAGAARGSVFPAQLLVRIAFDFRSFHRNDPPGYER